MPAQNNSSVAAGAQVQVTLANWLSKNRAAPASVWLAQTGQQDTPNENAPENATFSVTSPPDSKGNCTLLVTIPADLTSTPGAKTATQPYIMIVGGPGIYQRSASFAITSALTPTVSVTATPTSGGSGSGGGGGLLLVLGWIVAVLAFLGALGGVFYLVLNSQRGNGSAQPPQNPTPWGGASDSQWGGPQGGLWGDSPQNSGGVSTNWGQENQRSDPDWDAPTEPGRWPGDRP